MKELTTEDRAQAIRICDALDEAKKNLCERDWPNYRNKKTGQVVKLQGTVHSFYNPSVLVIRVEKDPNKRHRRTSSIGALSFEANYEPEPKK